MASIGAPSWGLTVMTMLILSGCSTKERAADPGSVLQSPSVSAAVPPQTKTNTTSIPKDEYVLTPEMEKRASIEVAPVSARMLSKSTTFSSSVEPTTSGSAIVNSLVRGVVTKISADVGQKVKAGQVLCYVNCPELSEAQSAWLTAIAKLQEAKAQQSSVISRLQIVKADVERQQTLNTEGISSTRQVQMVQANQSSTEAELAATKSVLAANKSYVAAAESRLKSFGLSTKNLTEGNLTSELPVTSPISGTVIKKTIQAGQTINPQGASNVNALEGMFTVVNLDKVWVMLEVPQSEVAALKMGATVTFTSEVAPGKTFRGHVITPGENFDAASRTVAVRVEIKNPDGTLKPGMLVLAKANEGLTANAVLSVDNRALQDIEGDMYVFREQSDHTFKKQAVKLGVKNEQYTEILRGLKAGDRVVTNGSFALKSEVLKANLVPDES
jgi:membrane fusion protein, heavy metal efflux system